MVFVLLMALTFGVVNAQTDRLTTAQTVTLYAGPGTTYAAVGDLRSDQPFAVQARNRLGNWVRVIPAGDTGAAGWVQTGHLETPPGALLLSRVPVGDMPDADLKRVDTTNTPRILYSTPVLPPSLNRDVLREVYERGQAQGNDPHSIAKVGDCNTASGLFLTPVSAGAFEVGPYDYLTDTINAYHDTFSRRSVASRDGFNVSSVFDPLWAISEACQPNEPPLLCEYRDNRPSVAFMMFGQNDILVLNREQYETFLRDAVVRSLEQGVIPVLSTFTNRPENAEHWGQITAMNVITIEVAQEYDVPLMNFWLAAHSLPAYGIGNDFAHLTIGGEGLSFAGREAQYGLTLYNLAVLNMLDTIYHEIIQP